MRSGVKSFLLVIFLLAGSVAFSQDLTYPPDKCSSLIAEAESQFEKGLYETSLGSLQNILDNCDLSRREREHVLELIAKIYVEIPDPVNAERSVEYLLKKFPHYELIENDNYEGFNRLVKKYAIHPAFSIGARNLALWRKYSTSEVFSLPGGPSNTEPYVSPGYSFTYYGWAELEFDHGISINAEFMWWWAVYNRYVKGPPDIDLHYWESQEYVEFPVYLKKYFYPARNILTYAAAGGGWMYMTRATGNVNNYSEADDKNYIVNDIPVISMRNRNIFEWTVGAGVGYKLKNLRFFGDLRYSGGITSLTKKENRLDNTQLINDFYYVDNSVKLNKIELGVSISYTFINSVKRNK